MVLLNVLLVFCVDPVQVWSAYATAVPCTDGGGVP
jgi:hypothetical protein